MLHLLLHNWTYVVRAILVVFVVALVICFIVGKRGKQLFVASAMVCGGIVLGVGSLVGSVILHAWVEDKGGDHLEVEPADSITLPSSTTRYVALGDSYSAGEGLHDYRGQQEDVDYRCHRSAHAAAQLVADASDLELTFAACSGATIGDLGGDLDGTRSTVTINGFELDDAMLDQHVGLVTMTLGGNDFGFSRVLRHCLTHYDCMSDEFDDSFDDGTKSGLTLQKWAEGRIPVIQTQLTAALELIKSRVAPKARIVIMGYPHLFPDGSFGSVDDFNSDCALLFFLIGPSEQHAVLQLEDQFLTAIEAAADAAGVEFLDLRSIFHHHEPCAYGGDRWVALGKISDEAVDPGDFHPTINGQAAYARALACYLNGPTRSPNVDVDALSDCFGYYG
jgi:lysophospholipase L1-like esterase